MNDSDRSRSLTMTNGMRKSFGPGGCQATTDSHRKCGETKTLQIIEEFRKLYENKMKQIDAEAGGDCVQAKINLQQDWIRDLTEQNEMLVRAVEELEVEAADRVNMLEEKLKSSSKCACEVMESYRDFSINLLEDLQKMERGQNDLNNLIELIRRARNDGEWNTEGLQFYGIDVNELLGFHTMANISYEDKEVTTVGLRKDCIVDDKLQKALKEKDKRLKELEERLKSEEGLESKKELQDLKKSMLDMRDALTAEVAHKHDTIVSLRHDVHLLEEQCRKADQQTHFKDDIIKELRKEIKQMKHQVHEDEIANLKKKIAELEEENKMMKDAIINAKDKLTTLEQKAELYLDEKNNIQRKHNESLSLIETLQKENARSNSRLETLQSDANSTLSDLQRDMIKELECCERTNRDSIEKIDVLRNELERNKKEQSKSIEQIAVLSEENRAQVKMIAALNAAIENKPDKPKMKSVCIGSSDGIECKRNIAINVPSSSVMKSVGVNNIPQMHNAATMLDEMECQIIRTNAPKPLDMEPRFHTPPRCDSPPRLGVPPRCNVAVGNLPPCSPRTQPRCPNKQVVIEEPDDYDGEIVEQPQPNPKCKMGFKMPIAGEKPIRLMHEPKLHDVLITTSNLILSSTENLCEAEDAMDCIQATTKQHFDVDVGQLPFFIPYTSNDFVGSASEKEIQRIVRTEILNNATREVFTGENLLPATDLDLALYTDMRETNKEPACIADCNISGIDFQKLPDATAFKIARLDQTSHYTTAQNLDQSSPYRTARSDQTSQYATGHTNILDQNSTYRTARSDQTSQYATGHTNILDQSSPYKTARLDQPSLYITGASSIDETTLYHMAPSTWEDHSTDSSEIKLNDCCQKAVEKTMMKQKLNELQKSGKVIKATNPPKLSPVAAEDPNVDAQRRDWAKYKSSLKSHRNENSSHASRDSNATDDLHNVVHDLNESVSRIMKKSTDDKASRNKIAELEEQLRMIRNKDEMINVQSDTLNIVQIELQALKQKEQEVEAERRKRGQEVENLKMTIREMEKALLNSQERSQNLQKAVDLYMNSINVLEGSEERWKIEIAQQRVTIANLQEALVTTKHQLEELQQKGAVDVSVGWATRWFGSGDDKPPNGQNKNVHEV